MVKMAESCIVTVFQFFIAFHLLSELQHGQHLFADVHLDPARYADCHIQHNQGQGGFECVCVLPWYADYLLHYCRADEQRVRYDLRLQVGCIFGLLASVCGTDLDDQRKRYAWQDYLFWHIGFYLYCFNGGF